jgi:two-component system, chemotaxis family, response regulator Rcp1
MTGSHFGNPIEILLVEDSPGDIRLTQEAMVDSRVNNKLSVVMDGEEAMRYLKREGEYSEVNLPDLILLDLNLPRKDGREVLDEIKQDPELKKIPVVILTTSRSEQDIIKTYESHANCYISKPVDLEEFLRVVRSINDFWLSIVTLPPK